MHVVLIFDLCTARSRRWCGHGECFQSSSGVRVCIRPSVQLSGMLLQGLLFPLYLNYCLMCFHWHLGNLQTRQDLFKDRLDNLFKDRLDNKSLSSDGDCTSEAVDFEEVNLNHSLIRRFRLSVLSAYRASCPPQGTSQAPPPPDNT